MQIQEIPRAHHLRNPLEIVEHGVSWVRENWVEILVAAIAGLVIYLALELVRRGLKGLFSKGADLNPVMGVFARTVACTGHVFLMLVALRLVLGYADPPPLLALTVRFLFTVAAAWQIALWVRQLAIGYIQLRSDPDHGGNEAMANASGLLKVLVSVAVFAIAIVAVLDNLGVNVTALVAGLGVGGIAIGLAAQGIFSDLFASLSILFDKPFKLGDTINFGSMTATVERIGLKSTRLRAVNGERLIVANAQLLNKEIVSFAGLDRRRLKLMLGITYQTRPEQAEAIPDMLRQVVEAEGTSFVRCGFTGFGDSALNFELEFDVYSGDWDEVYAARHRVGLAILRRFREAGVDFAYPTQTTFTAAPDGTLVMPYPASPPQGR